MLQYEVQQTASAMRSSTAVTDEVGLVFLPQALTSHREDTVYVNRTRSTFYLTHQSLYSVVFTLHHGPYRDLEQVLMIETLDDLDVSVSLQLCLHYVFYYLQSFYTCYVCFLCEI